MMFWIVFDLIFAFFYMQVITIVFCIVLDFISTFFCMQVIHMLFWGEVNLIFTLSSLQTRLYVVTLPFANQPSKIKTFFSGKLKA